MKKIRYFIYINPRMDRLNLKFVSLNRLGVKFVTLNRFGHEIPSLLEKFEKMNFKTKLNASKHAPDWLLKRKVVIIRIYTFKKRGSYKIN
jgi:hypothetical protein